MQRPLMKGPAGSSILRTSERPGENVPARPIRYLLGVAEDMGSNAGAKPGVAPGFPRVRLDLGTPP